MWSQYPGGQRDFELVPEMGSNPCLTFLLVYSALITIALMVTSTLLATNHSTVVCKGGGEGGEEVTVNHYAVIDASKDEIDDKPEHPCKCQCNCKQEELITGIEVFTVTVLGIIITAILVYSCLALRYCILKQRKINVQLALEEEKRLQEESEKQEKEKRLKLIEELKNEAIELRDMQKMPRKQDEY